jgi:RHS repeat-associated protein
VEVLGERTAFSQTFVNPNGTTTLTESARPRWVRRGSTWIDASADLVQGSDGSWSPAAAEAGLSVSGGGNKALATVTSGSHSMSVTWPSVLPVPTVSGATATYRNVFPGVDLVLIAQVTGGFDETLVIRDKSAAADPQLQGLQLGVSMSPGLVQHASPDGSVTIDTASGQKVFASPAPVAWDSSAAGSSVAGPGAGAAVSGVRADYSRGSVRLGMPAGLSREKFPVYVDPSYGLTVTFPGYGEIQSANPTTSDFRGTPDGKVRVGFSGGIVRGGYVFFFPSGLSAPTTTVLSATVNATVAFATTATSTSHTVNLYSTSQFGSTSTWNNPPTQLAGPTATTFTTTSTAPNLAVSWDVASYVQADFQARSSNLSAELVNSNETSNTVEVEFANNPTLSVTYDRNPGVPAVNVSPQDWATDGNQYTSSATPSLAINASDPDGDSVQYQAQILSGATVVASGTTGFVTSGTWATWADPVTLSDNTTYTYQARAWDGTEWGAWSTARTFTVVTDTPAAPAVTCTAYPSGTWTALASGGTTCSWSAPLPHMNGYSWKIDGGSGGWSSGPSISINPGVGLHTLSVTPMSAAGIYGPAAKYTFGVGTSGAVTAPAGASQTATTVPLQAAAPAGYTSAEFDYRVGATGTFQPVPGFTWPVSMTSGSAGVQTAKLTWPVTQTVADDGPVQVEAIFTGGPSGTLTTAPVTVTLDRLGTGVDFGTTQAGPATVGLQSGNAALSATDVTIASYGTALAVTRTFNSLAPAKPSVFGPGWTSSLTGGVTASWTQLTDSGTYVVLAGVDGTEDTFTQGTTTGGATSYVPQGAAVTAGLVLTKNTTTSTFTLTDSSGTVTTFAQAATGGASLPQTITQPGGASSTGIVYDSTSGDATYGDPLLLVAPDAASSQPPTTACPYPASGSTWTAGCRGLKLAYNVSGNVTGIDFVYSDNAGTFHDVQVAAYGYDTSGRLTSESDPRLSTPLVTGYAYDETSSDANYGRVTQVTPAQSASSGALAPWTLTYDVTSGDANFGKLLSASRTHSATYGGGTATTTIVYSVPPTTAAGGPVNMDVATVATWGQSDPPASAVATFPPSRVPASPPTATDYQYAQIDYYDASGRPVNTASYVNGAWAVTTTQYDAYGNTISSLSAANRATALASSSPAATAYALSDLSLYGCDNFGTVSPCTANTQQYQVLTDTYGPAHDANVAGTVQQIRTHVAYGYDASAPNSDVSADGSPYMLTTSQTTSASLGAQVPATATADARTVGYAYASASTSIGWTLGAPLSTTTDPGGLNITSTAVYNTSSSLYDGASLQTGSYMPSNASGSGAGDTETVYYTAGTNPVVAACGNKPEWANLTCQVGPAAQPGTSGLPALPVTTIAYDDYLNPVTKTETFGTTGTRVTATTYDSAERPSTQAITVTGTGMGIAIPKTRTVYSTSSGLPTDTQTLDSSNNVTADINAGYDDFGQGLTYIDASGNATSYAYDIAGRPTSRNDGKGTETLSYTGGFGAPTQITDSQAGTFTGTYNPDGSLTSEVYPGGITGTYAYDPTGTATSVSYNGAAWTAPLTDTVVPNAAGDWATQAITDTATPTVSTQAYTYDNADRLTKVQDTLAGLCTTRGYGFDADSNRTGLTSYTPNADGSCQATTGTTVTHAYDSADRVTTTGYAFDTQGNITTTPSADAGGTGNLTATYDANNMLANQSQNGSSMTWALDPTLGRFATYSQAGVTYTNHYSDTSNNPAWTLASTGGWQRSVTDFNGTLAAQVTGTGTTLELSDLHGDIMATATTGPTATGPTATYVYNEFGTSETGPPGPYGWLGGDQISSNALGGQLLMGARAYETATGRFSQPDPVPGGSANAYDYARQNPIEQFDLSGGISATRSCYFHLQWWGRAWGCTYYFSRNQTQNLERDVQANGVWVGALVIDAAVCVWFGFAAAPCGAIAVLYEYWAVHEINAASRIGGCFAISVGVSVTWWADVEWTLAFRATSPRYRYCRPLSICRVRLILISV